MFRMNCQNFEDVVNDLARDQIMEVDARARIIEHSVKCPACAQRLEGERLLAVDLRALAAEMKSLEAPEPVEKQLRAAFRSGGLQQRSSSNNRLGYVTAAAAAVVLIMFGIVAIRLRPMSSPPPEKLLVKPEQIAIDTRPTVPPASLARPGVALSWKPKIVRAGNFRQTNRRSFATHYSNRERNSTLAAASAATAITDSQRREVATDFMPLGYISSMNLQDGAQLVRVELPRSAMVSFGLPVNMDRYGERVKADVLVGADGLARAIRFIQ
ncbi:MAG TPA: hypothetical protein DHU55_13025 [Blastocatellia bacterium]|nr:hypothetical protein [Blastocatellia bacterium]